MSNTRKYLIIPLVVAFAAATGLLIGTFMERSNHYIAAPQIQEGSDLSEFEKINSVLSLLQQVYVDTVNADKLAEDVIPQILRDLDPHSAYIPKDEVEESNEDLSGSFSGIGVQFNIQNDTVMIVDVIAGGPSEKMGLRAGDRIVQVNDSDFTGKHISTTKIQKTLRGEKGTQVRVGIRRVDVPEMLSFTITRGDIPVNSVDIAYLLNEYTGYIKVSRFGATTYTEFLTALMQLKQKGCNRYIIDLRNNSGGYLNTAIQMVNEFLERGDLIVYTEGRTIPRENALADGNGRFRSGSVCVLINEWSASASEIFAGAIQDQDRGWVIGRRSFGKGLVQQQIPMSDGSEIRLTIARYHTPSGRCIQKPYQQGEMDDYEQDLTDRYNRGEFFAADSIRAGDSLQVFHTRLNRTVYGGGGIMPDIFVGQDTSFFNAYYQKAFNSSLLYDFAFQYADKHRKSLSHIKDGLVLERQLRQDGCFEEFVRYADSKGLARDDEQIAVAKAELANMLYAYIARNLLGDKGFYPILHLRDQTLKKAMEVIRKPLQ